MHFSNVVLSQLLSFRCYSSRCEDPHDPNPPHQENGVYSCVAANIFRAIHLELQSGGEEFSQVVSRRAANGVKMGQHLKNQKLMEQSLEDDLTLDKQDEFFCEGILKSSG